MPTNMDLYVPSSPTRFNYRPLSAGMVTSDTSMAMPNGSFLDVNGYDVTTRGPVKHGGWTFGGISDAHGDPMEFEFFSPDSRIEDFTQFTLSDGTTLELVVTNRCLYVVDEILGYRRVNWSQPFVFDAVFQNLSNTEFTLTGDYTKHYLNGFDFVVFDGVTYPILTFTQDAVETKISFLGIPPIGAITEFRIVKPFDALDEQYVDFAIARFWMYFVDGITRMIWKFDGIERIDGHYYLEPHIIRSNTTERCIMGARTITAFSERLYFGGVLEEEWWNGVTLLNKSYPQRVRWTEVLNHAVCYASNYQDLTRTSGRITKLKGMGGLIMVYFTDSLYYGRATNMTSLPYIFTYIESAGTSAISMRAVSTYFDGQIFLGADNLYLVTADIQVTPLGDNISDSLREQSGVPHMTVVMVDVPRSRIVVAVSNSTDYIDCLFFFNYKAKAWSRNTSVRITAPSLAANSSYLYYNSLPVADTYLTTPLRLDTYKSLLTSSSLKSFYGFMNDYFMRYDETLALNELMVGGFPTFLENPSELITPDFDFDEPDTDKTALRVSLKITEVDKNLRTNDIFYQVLASRDRGLTWKTLGRMRIKPQHDEDALNFRFMGSTLRFKFRTGFSSDAPLTDVLPFTISEVILQIRERAIEAQRDNARQ